MDLFRKIKSGFTSFLVLATGLLLLSGLMYGQAADLRLVAKPYGMVCHSANHYPGSEFLFSEWMPGEIQLINGQSIPNLKLNYNAYTDAMVYAAEGNTPVQLSKYQVKACLIHSNTGDRSFVVSENDSNLQSVLDKPGFLEVLYDGAIKLYAERSLKINTTLVSDNPFQKSIYYADDKYLVCIQGKWITRPNKPGSYFAFYEKSTVRKIIRSQKLILKNEADLIQFLSELEPIEIMPNEN